MFSGEYLHSRVQTPLYFSKTNTVKVGKYIQKKYDDEKIETPKKILDTPL